MAKPITLDELICVGSRLFRQATGAEVDAKPVGHPVFIVCGTKGSQPPTIQEYRTLLEHHFPSMGANAFCTYVDVVRYGYSISYVRVASIQYYMIMDE